MRLTAGAVRARTRRALTRRDWTSDWRRRGRRRTWVGARGRSSGDRPLFLALRAQHMRRARPADWLAAAATLLAVLSWGVLAALIGT
jgi:hypothetical protein